MKATNEQQGAEAGSERQDIAERSSEPVPAKPVDTEREKADEEEWKARRLVIQQQAEEARALKKLAREKAAKSNVEQRALARLEDHRRKEADRIAAEVAKETMRSRIRESLNKCVKGHKTLYHVLLAMGVKVENNSQEAVLKAFKQAKRQYHPDRYMNASLEQQLHAEESFKIISQVAQKV